MPLVDASCFRILFSVVLTVNRFSSFLRKFRQYPLLTILFEMMYILIQCLVFGVK